MIDFHKTFAPVVNWFTFRLIIMMADMDGWESRQIDYVLDSLTHQLIVVFIFIYQHFFYMLQTGLKDEGIKQNKMDLCIFVRNNDIVIFYVDDCCI